MNYKTIKLLSDKIIALFLLIITLPLFLILGFLIYKEDKGSILYISERLGKKGLKFRIYKFRTMKMHAPDLRNDDGSTKTSDEDHRVTKIGKKLRATSLDELPQLINVLKGEMSLVGPRPDLPDAILIYQDCEKKKLDVNPGITGYNQAYFRNSVSQKEKFRNDVFYVENLSMSLDAKILAVTFKNVALKKHIN